MLVLFGDATACRSIDGDFERRMAECILQDAMRQFSASGASSIYSIYFGGGKEHVVYCTGVIST